MVKGCCDWLFTPICHQLCPKNTEITALARYTQQHGSCCVVLLGGVNLGGVNLGGRSWTPSPNWTITL